ncbi:hypothetical protein [Nocardia sp. NPDC050175]|uniref:hypothetical protein n=1 Tax=Nocardia sp. NPDC050175 TaxID=3364317 RepID=UPI0037AE6061
MPQPSSTQHLTARIDRLPAPIPAAWAARIRMHTGIEGFIGRIQRQHYRFRDTVAWPGLRRIGVGEQLLDTARVRHGRIFDRVYDVARTAHWYV